MAIFDFIEGWYNPRRRHSSLGRVSPLSSSRNTKRRCWLPNYTLSTK
jgi:putative transposase